MTNLFRSYKWFSKLDVFTCYQSKKAVSVSKSKVLFIFTAAKDKGLLKIIKFY